MTNKDYSYLQELLEETILICFNKMYHPGLVSPNRIERMQEMTSHLQPDEKEYIKIKCLEFFQELKRDHEQNMTQKR